MVRLQALLVPHDGMALSGFHAHWRYVHGPLASRIRRALAYVQCHRLPWQPDDLPVLPNGGSAEVWFEDLASADALMDDPDYLDNAAKDEDNFHHMDRMTVLRSSAPVVLLDGPPVRQDSTGVKLMQFVRRAPGLSPEDFAGQWTAPAAGDAAAPELRVERHQRAVAIAEHYADDPDPRFDGVRELWWPDTWSFIAARASAPGAWERLVG